MGWFYGFKLHLIINDKGEIINFAITPGDVDDRQPLYNPTFVEKITGNYVVIRAISVNRCLRICLWEVSN